MSLALARKYRPRNFASVAVQSHVSNTLKGAIARGRVAHGYLLCGPRGTGKTTLARVLAMALNCETRLAARAAAGADAAADSGEPCGECASCTRIWSGGASLDVVEIDAASNRGVDDARELRERAMYAPSGDDGYKVYIVDEAHMLTREAWNALLKVLEEPPPRVVFVFATTEPQKIAQTAAPVMSRLQRFDLKRIGPAEIRERLAAVLAAEGVEAEPEALAMLARAADGGLRDALSLTDQVLSLGTDARVTAERVRDALGLVPEDEFLTILELLADGRAGDVFGAVARLVDAGVDLGTFLTGLGDMLRAQLAVVLGGVAGDLSDDTRRALEERRDRLSAGDLLRMLNALAELEPHFRKSGQQQLLLETILVRFALMDRSVQLEELLRQLGGPHGGGGGGGGGDADERLRRATSSAAARPTARPDAAPPAAPREAADGARTAAPPDAPAARYGSAPAVTAPSVSAPAVTAPAVSAPRPAPPAPPPVARSGVGSPATLAASGRGVAVADAPATLTTVAEPAPPAGAPRAAPPDLHHLVARWEEVPARLRADGRALVASLLEHVLPVAVSAGGVVALEVEDETALPALEGASEGIAAALRTIFGGIERCTIRRSPSARAAAPAQRLTLESVREERLARLRQRDPTLASAIDALDLELLD